MTVHYTYKGMTPPKVEDYYLENLNVKQLESLLNAHEGEVQWMLLKRITELNKKNNYGLEKK